MWSCRVAVANWLLARAGTGYQFSVRGLDWQNGLVARDVTMTRRADGVVAARIPVLRVEGSFADFRAARVTALRLERPDLLLDLEQLMEGFRPPPGPPLPPEVPLFTIGAVEITEAKVTWRSTENTMRSGRGTLSGRGGEWRIYPDGSLSAARQEISLTETEIGLKLDSHPLTDMRISAAAGTGALSIDHASRVLTVHTVRLENAVCDAAELPLHIPAPPAGPEEPASTERDTVEAVVVEHAEIAGGTLQAAVLNQTQRVPVSATFSASGGDMRFLDVPATIGRLSWPDLSVSSGSSTVPLGRGTMSLRGTDVTLGPQDEIHVDLAGLPEWLKLSGMSEKEILALPRLTGTAMVKGGAFSAGSSGLRSAALVDLRAENVKLSLPEAPGTVMSIPSAALAFVPDELIRDRRVRLVEAKDPDIHLTTVFVYPAVAAGKGAVQAVAPLLSAAAGPVVPGDDRSAAAGVPFWEGLNADRISITGGKFAVKKAGLLIPDASADFHITTGPREAGGPVLHRAVAEKFCVDHPVLPGSRLCSAEEIHVDIDPARIWNEREIEEVRFVKSTPEIDRTLSELLAAAKAVNSGGKPPETSPPPPGYRPWKVRRYLLSDTRVKIRGIIGAREVEFGIPRLEFTDLPLDAGALEQLDQEYEVTVPRITLYSPFMEGFKVAELEDNVLTFTPSGLFGRKLTAVRLGRPTVFVSQHLFDFIDSMRRPAPAGESVTRAADQPAILLADSDSSSPAVQSALHAAQTAPAPPEPRWDIPLFINDGRLVVALKGNVNQSIPVLPFRNATDKDGRMQRLQFDGESVSGALALKPQTYRFPDYKVTVQLREYGGVSFNLPSSDKNNNLVEVFRNVRIVFRQIVIEEAWLSVTYDKAGVYATFGGTSCGGYLKGGVNVYLDEHYSWDAWVSLTDLNLGTLTAALAPEYVTITGKMKELTVKAAGDSLSLYQLTCSLSIPGAGRLTIPAIDALQEKIAALDPGLSTEALRLAVESLRECPYSSGTGHLKLIGREGELALDLQSPRGKREFLIRFHDYSAKLPRITLPF